MPPVIKHEDYVLAKLVDGNFVVGRYIEHGPEKLRFIQNAYLLIMQQTPDGGIRVAIADFFAPFIQDGAGAVFSERDWIGMPQPMPDALIGDYTQKKTGIRLATSMPGSPIVGI
jgi:hypothetical protein